MEVDDSQEIPSEKTVVNTTEENKSDTQCDVKMSDEELSVKNKNNAISIVPYNDSEESSSEESSSDEEMKGQNIGESRTEERSYDDEIKNVNNCETSTKVNGTNGQVNDKNIVDSSKEESSSEDELDDRKDSESSSEESSSDVEIKDAQLSEEEKRSDIEIGNSKLISTKDETLTEIESHEEQIIINKEMEKSEDLCAKNTNAKNEISKELQEKENESNLDVEMHMNEENDQSLSVESTNKVKESLQMINENSNETSKVQNDLDEENMAVNHLDDSVNMHDVNDDVKPVIPSHEEMQVIDDSNDHASKPESFLPISVDDIKQEKDEDIVNSYRIDTNMRIYVSDSSSDDGTTTFSDTDHEEMTDQEEKPKIQRSRKKMAHLTEGELTLSDLPSLDNLHVTIGDEVQMQQVGYIRNVIGVLVIIQSLKDIPALDEDTIFFLENRKILGQVHETFGPVTCPLYQVRFNSEEDIVKAGVQTDMAVYHAPGHSEFTRYIFISQLLKVKGSDASWENNNEPPKDHVEYSDDEEERLAKQAHKKRYTDGNNKFQKKRQRRQMSRHQQMHQEDDNRFKSLDSWPPKPKHFKDSTLVNPQFKPPVNPHSNPNSLPATLLPSRFATESNHMCSPAPSPSPTLPLQINTQTGYHSAFGSTSNLFQQPPPSPSLNIPLSSLMLPPPPPPTPPTDRFTTSPSPVNQTTFLPRFDTPPPPIPTPPLQSPSLSAHTFYPAFSKPSSTFPPNIATPPPPPPSPQTVVISSIAGNMTTQSANSVIFSNGVQQVQSFTAQPQGLVMQSQAQVANPSPSPFTTQIANVNSVFQQNPQTQQVLQNSITQGINTMQNPAGSLQQISTPQVIFPTAQTVQTNVIAPATMPQTFQQLAAQQNIASFGLSESIQQTANPFVFTKPVQTNTLQQTNTTPQVIVPSNNAQLEVIVQSNNAQQHVAYANTVQQPALVQTNAVQQAIAQTNAVQQQQQPAIAQTNAVQQHVVIPMSLPQNNTIQKFTDTSAISTGALQVSHPPVNFSTSQANILHHPVQQHATQLQVAQTQVIVPTSQTQQPQQTYIQSQLSNVPVQPSQLSNLTNNNPILTNNTPTQPPPLVIPSSFTAPPPSPSIVSIQPVGTPQNDVVDTRFVQNPNVSI